MSRHVEFRHHSNAAITSVSDYVTRFRLRVEEAVRTVLLQARKLFAFHTETLVVGKVPMEDVQLYGSHAVQGSLHMIGGNKVA